MIRRRESRARAFVYGAVLLVVVAAWFLLTATAVVKPILLASPADTWGALVALLREPNELVDAVTVTLGETLVAFLIAAAAAVPLGVLVGSSALMSRAQEPVLTSVGALPLVILYPAIAAIVGIGSSSKVVIGCLYAFFPMAIAALRAAATIDRRLVVAGAVMGASRTQLLSHVMLPAIAAPVIGSMRVAAGLALVTIIAGEFISGSEGVGYQLGVASQGLDTPGLFAWVTVACAVTIAVNGAFSVVTNTVQKGVTR
jgi:ABC-type nitrate/sulfonate/bicarbonate transport system permease component